MAGTAKISRAEGYSTFQRTGTDLQREHGWWIVLLAVLCLVPFLNKPLHIDDPLFVWSAQRIVESPADFFGIDVNWYGRPMPLDEVTKNPPLTCYYLALLGALFGWSEVALHTGMLLPAGLAAGGILRVARRGCATPSVAAGLAVLSPAFVVSGTTLMCDMMELAFWCWAIEAWLAGGATDNWKWDLLAAVCVAGAIWTKFIGLGLIPLLLVYELIRSRRVSARFIWLLIPVLAAAGLDYWAWQQYGHTLLWGAAEYAAEHGPERSGVVERLFVATVFLGGCVPGAALACLGGLSRRQWMLTGAVVLGTTVAVGGLLLASQTIVKLGPLMLANGTSLRWDSLWQLGICFAGGLAILASVAWSALRRRDEFTWLLVMWFAGVFVFASVVNWTINARSLLPLAPAAAILATRWWETRLAHTGRSMPSWPWRGAGAVALAMLSLWVAWGDVQWARSARNAAEWIAADQSDQTSRVWFQGHWGFQYYAQLAGMAPLDLTDGVLEPNHLMVLPENNTSLFDFSPLRLADGQVLFQPVGEFDVMVDSWCHTGQPALGASFYASVRGPLPYAFGPSQREVYRLFQTIKPVHPGVEIR
jgi:4-amino-4-deoxy-L-arabinose transferase-like glycosyltransferase